MTSKIVGAVLFIMLGGIGGYVLASNPHVIAYFHRQELTLLADHAQPHLDPETKYRLQERCADRAKKFYEDEYEQSYVESTKHLKSSNFIIQTYLDHYNEQLNKCFMLVRIKSSTWGGYEVVDVNSREQIATYFSEYDCQVHEITCRSESDWWALVQPYIEELALSSRI